MSQRHGGWGHGEPHFAVLPDREAATAVAPLLQTPEARILFHPSGRPWLVGQWADDEITTAQVGDTQLAVIGCCPVTEAELAGEAQRLRDLTTLDRLARTLVGSAHLIAAKDGELRVQGTASGLRLVFHTRVRGVTVAADRADLLASLAGAELDERQVAARLLWPVPHPLPQTPLWNGVEAVPPDSYLLVGQDGLGGRVSRWWSPPEPVWSLATQAPLIAEALGTAVDARTRGGGVVSADLSGGLDSTSICFLAARGDARVIASTWPGRDPADDDLVWARRAAAHLPAVEHRVWPAEQSPLVYEKLLDIDDPLDEPTIGVMDRARALSHLPQLAAEGSRVHLTGIGGDHLAWSSEAHLHTLLRRRPLLALRRLRGFRALFTWQVGGMVRALADARSYRQWLADAARQLDAPNPSSAGALLGWGMPPRLFGWVTRKAADAARDVLRETADTAEPLAPDRGQHADLSQIRDATRIIRHWDQMSARMGLPTASPFLDDRVIEACLAVRPEERVTPWQYKPLLGAAMQGLVPAECLARTSKAQATMDAAAGLREHRGDLLALWQDSRLARLGLVDAEQLAALAHRPATPELRQPILYSTIGCEVWLRTLVTDGRESVVTGHC
jgi:asparagine synthase (glutamine-hydrolysing)